MTNYLVSVIIPAYNCADYISEAINSVLSQNVDLEIIVVDDCSSDNLSNVMANHLKNKNVTYIKNNKHSGVAKSRNVGVSVAKGDYIAFLDADDIWMPSKLSKQLCELKRTGFVLCTTARELIDTKGRTLNHIIPVKSVITYNELLKHNSISCSSVLIKADVAKEFPMHNDDCHEDYIMWLEVLSKYKKACGINEPLIKYRISSKSKSGSKFQSAKMTFKVYRKIGLNIPKSLMYFTSYIFNGVKKHFY